MLDLPLGILVSDILKLEKSFQSLKKLSEITLDAQIGKELKQEKIEIPSEILIFIFSHLKINELGTLRNVSKKFRFAATKTLDSICRGALASFMSPSLLVEISQESSGITTLYKLSPTDLRDQDWIGFSLTDDFLMNGAFGFIGLASKVADICGPLFSKDVREYPDTDSTESSSSGPLRDFDRDAFVRLNEFLKNGWASLEDSLPLNLRPVYGSIFKHILNTFDSLIENPKDKMRINTQMALVTQIWKVVDMIAPKKARDVRFETPSSLEGTQSFYYDLLIKLERELGLGEPDNRPCEFPPVSLSPNPDNQTNVAFTTNWEWNTSAGKLRSVTCSFSLKGDRFNFPAHFEITGLQQGENYDFCSVSNVALRVPKAYLSA